MSEGSGVGVQGLKAGSKTLEHLLQHDDFIHRHIGLNEGDIQEMLRVIGEESLESLTHATVPENIQFNDSLTIGKPTSEVDALKYLRNLAKQNKVFKSYIGMGYYGTHTPHVILRNVLENPGWYTAYTPYQAEISQGRLETLLTFQQMVIDLTGMEVANASLLDEATAAAEAMTLCKRSSGSKSNTYFVADDIHPQTLDVIKTRAKYLGIQIIVGKPETDLDAHDVYGVHLNYPGTTGEVRDLEVIIKLAHEKNVLVTVASDLLALVMLKPPGEMGADVVVGSAQRFGVPMGFGGPHAAFFATRDTFKRSMPGRVIGVSVDSKGKTALRMAMQTREQHIRREKATSNICTAQALLANMAALYAVYHGPAGLKIIAERVHRLTTILATGLKQLGYTLQHETYFDTLMILVGHKQLALFQYAQQRGVNLRLINGNALGVSLDETTTARDIDALLSVFAQADLKQVEELDKALSFQPSAIHENLRTTEFLTHSVFNTYHSETEMLRYLKKLENKDFSLTHGMIPLGSCTMKLNATAEMMPVTWNEFANLHPFAPQEQSRGYAHLLNELEDMLEDMTGFDAVSLQPNSGAQGEYAGLLTIRRYQESLGQGHRDICLIPSSAHGTNPASAIMMGMKVVVVKCDENGNVDLSDLKAKAGEHTANLSALMITYPSTHGVFEEAAKEMCDIVHAHGGQVYMDGANLNAQVGVTKPALIGADVSHMNLHKTFCIPHGGGGPGMGPIGVKKHLEPFLPGHFITNNEGITNNDGAVTAAPYGSAAILPISWMYIKMMGSEGLRKATQVAILNANYIAKKLEGHFDVLYKGRNDKVAHECILDIRPIKEATAITEEDIAKRLMDYGFHAPTMSWPVAGTMMVEPTESESKHELDRFIDAMISIRNEIRNVEQGVYTAEQSPLHNAPHTLDDVVTEWNYVYSRADAIYPSRAVKHNKYFPTVNRIDNVYGDRHFVCTCPPMEDYELVGNE
ncbi:MAG: aminomethyl-transferring glycine dehydrogenase [Trueperaceae bacterium]